MASKVAILKKNKYIAFKPHKNEKNKIVVLFYLTNDKNMGKIERSEMEIRAKLH